jgi:hypothetical protein
VAPAGASRIPNALAAIGRRTDTAIVHGTSSPFTSPPAPPGSAPPRPDRRLAAHPSRLAHRRLLTAHLVAFAVVTSTAIALTTYDCGALWWLVPIAVATRLAA